MGGLCGDWDGKFILISLSSSFILGWRRNGEGKWGKGKRRRRTGRGWWGMKMMGNKIDHGYIKNKVKYDIGGRSGGSWGGV